MNWQFPEPSSPPSKKGPTTATPRNRSQRPSKTLPGCRRSSAELEAALKVPHARRRRRRRLLSPHLLTLRQAPRGQPIPTAPCSGIGQMIMLVSVQVIGLVAILSLQEENDGRLSVPSGIILSVSHAGPSSYSNSGNLTPASASASVSAFGQKKRTFGAHLDDDASSGSRVKSRRTTPSPQHTAITTPSVGGDFWADDASVIDLTGYVYVVATKWRRLRFPA